MLSRTLVILAGEALRNHRFLCFSPPKNAKPIAQYAVLQINRRHINTFYPDLNPYESKQTYELLINYLIIKIWGIYIVKGVIVYV
ncbi:hypothetical protein CJ235_08825 [Staphylococcus pettenkoferi]|uniref:Uncharacterized protein n=1 Tax=Staphylococcus pettenkoferi TaxID=170573 RepID=A0A2N6QG05_9STAP|nr:hypothetical protein CJ235_08825 [Staphylococcus pettenkoferi]